MSVSIWIGVFLLVAGSVLAVVAGGRAQRRELVEARLALVAANFAQPNNMGFHRLVSWLPAPKASEAVQQLLVQAGFHHPQAARVFMGLKVLSMTVCGVGWLLAKDEGVNSLVLAEALVSAICAGLLLEHALKWRAREINQRIARSLPDALDLMVVCVESGLTLEAVFERVGREMARVAPELSREWLITEAELRLLDTRRTALENLARRTALAEIENMVVALSQTEQYGSPVAQTIRLLAADTRQYQYLRVEEAVGKIPAKMSIPVVVLVMMPVVVLIVAPTVIALLESLGGL
ncbi:type II secretion system F family protein [Photobacterium sp. TY1-4]|uniref:type II secretion system F family protein n=1 Tax=Photobacterium sp. TY1-4 TaxID=2899122 RepID=UPI0021C07336|nr:type II secretion system F family protein [Photobacterium sp. TY1-4]UXI03629.1 type II secretion system F family protein [Photobacterium sp. TY1-4]